MAILRAMDGTFYEIPDDQVAKFKIPPEKLKDKIGAQAMSEGPPSGGPPPEGGGGTGSPLVNVHIHYAGEPGGGGPGGAAAPGAAEGAVQPYDWRNWRNWHNWNNWRNWRNRWD